MAYVYRHINNDNNKTFYIGIGSDKNFYRAYVTKGRTKYWKNIVNKFGYTVKIIEDDLSWEEACEREKYWIKFYGRCDLNEGTLVNMTDGGEGIPNPSNQLRKKWSEVKKGKPLSEQHKKKISMAKKGIKQSEEHIKKLSEIRKGRKASEETKKKMSEARVGKKLPPFTSEHKLNMSKAQSGRTLKDDTKRKIGESNKGKKKPTIECPHCKLIGSIQVIKRWHFDNCKHKK